ncbi:MULTISPECIES: GNAT family N-acetyltransferase [Arthrobacter]|uniref:GNAT family N-acetyltransferase n=1 Tax=Arthrobacter terricola TaxID=2547396 RepID=A0A4R5K9S9_9MICC|nr:MULTISPECIES: GNAT family N-acetyltransferase [Arthrobacter]MBT8163015.1 GNAT family N-acetyltransferase [Arthrobacter sp. GN70]TDF91779.1 GNAT family N-acetyltransferase [Arthrobacter terricola]
MEAAILATDRRFSGASVAAFELCPKLTDEALNDLFSESWPGHQSRSFAPVLSQSLLWVGAFLDRRLVGFVNVAGDRGIHTFILDTTVHPDHRRTGLGLRLLGFAAPEAKARGAQWPHVDYERLLEGFYAGCGFSPTSAGLMNLSQGTV